MVSFLYERFFINFVISNSIHDKEKEDRERERENSFTITG